MRKRNIAYLLAACASVALAAAAVRHHYKKTPAFSEGGGLAPLLFPAITEDSFAAGAAEITRRRTFFSDGSEFAVSRLRFEAGTGQYTYEIPVAGEDITIRWQNYAAQPYTWELSDADALPKATLFIETSEENAIVSIPALYYERFEHKTLECLSERERAAAIAETEGGYTVMLTFEPIDGSFGEFWYFKAATPIIEWSREREAFWLRQDLHKNRRFSMDGYYFKTYESYEPFSENGFFRNPANFTGAQIMKDGGGSSVNLGRAMTKLCLQNQNGYGFWETGPRSDWLYEDYGIGYDFYDTRFSTDFARSLVYAYTEYGDSELLNGALVYADFLENYAQDYGYAGGEAGDGVLLPDYWSADMKLRPHVSLNHQLNEINFLLELYMAVEDEARKELALKLLKGLENTGAQWLQPDGNLKYALMYDESIRQLYDYPYLTYNDLYDTTRLLTAIGLKSETLETLMESKRQWMDNNGVTGYKR